MSDTTVISAAANAALFVARRNTTDNGAKHGPAERAVSWAWRTLGAFQGAADEADEAAGEARQID